MYSVIHCKPRWTEDAEEIRGITIATQQTQLAVVQLLFLEGVIDTKKVKVEVQQHLYNGIIKNYTRWYLHGEDENDETDESNSDSDSDGSENDVINMEQDDDMHGLVEEGCPQDPNRDAEKI
ncbi:hypothetical protein DVH24_009927 [Malus domestica]|uniref:Uncharacterized protein n=1 Tax=Malus domestica TaxID=3750 RepID=A0A498JVV7_MALDO|nr:hypothetical protein DVH24_009927 [Malus domestica]